MKTWTASGTGKASLSRTATVSRGQTYKLIVNAKINGVAQPQRSITKTSPSRSKEVSLYQQVLKMEQAYVV